MPYPGSGAKMKPRCVSRSARTSRGARPSGPARTTSTGGHRRVDGTTCVDPERVRFGRRTHRGEHAHRTVEACARQRHIADVVVRRPILAVRRVTLARHDDHSDVRERREHRRTRPHHHVEPPVRDREPRPVPRTLVPSDEHRDPLPERLHDRRRGRRHRHRLRHQHDRPPLPHRDTAEPPRPRRPPRPPAPAEPRTCPPQTKSAGERDTVPIRRGEVEGRGRTSGGGGSPAERGMGWLGERSGAVAATPPRASPVANPSLFAQRPEEAPRSRSPRPAERCTARSPTAATRAWPRRRTRTGDTTFFTSEHPRSEHAEVRAPTRGSADRGTAPGRATRRPASSSGGSRYVNGRSRLRTGRSMQTATGPSKRSVAKRSLANAVGAG